MKKTICLILSVVLMLTVFTGCDKKMTMEEILEDTNLVVGKVGDLDVYAYEMLYLMSMQYDAETAFEELKNVKVMYQKALENGIEYTDEDKKALDDELNEMIEQYGGKEAFDKVLKQFGLTYDQYYAITTMSEHVSKLNEKVVELGLFKEATEDQVKAFFDANVLKAKHILVTTVNPETGEALSEEEIKAKKALIEETYAKIAAGADFDSFKNLNEDPGSVESPDGYVFINTENIKDDETTLSLFQQAGMTMVSEFEKGAAALDFDKVSEPVETTYGYHIIKRVAFTEEDYEENKAMVQSVLNNANYQKLIKEWSAEFDSKTKKYEKIIASIDIALFQDMMAAENKTEETPEAETAE